MPKLYNRQPYSVNTNIKENFQYFSHANWKGIQEGHNYLNLDQETFSDAENVYIDDDGLLRSREPIIVSERYKQVNNYLLENNITDYDIENIWTITDNRFMIYLLNVRDTSSRYLLVEKDVNGIKNYLLITDFPLSSANVKIQYVNNKIFFFTDDGIFYYKTDCDDNCIVTDQEKIFYTPITKTTIGNSVEEAESVNKLYGRYIERYVYNKDVPFESYINLYGKNVTIDETTKTFDKNTLKTLFFEQFELPQNVKNDENLQIIAGRNEQILLYSSEHKTFWYYKNYLPINVFVLPNDFIELSRLKFSTLGDCVYFLVNDGSNEQYYYYDILNNDIYTLSIQNTLYTPKYFITMYSKLVYVEICLYSEAIGYYVHNNEVLLIDYDYVLENGDVGSNTLKYEYGDKGTDNYIYANIRKIFDGYNENEIAADIQALDDGNFRLTLSFVGNPFIILGTNDARTYRNRLCIVQNIFSSQSISSECAVVLSELVDVKNFDTYDDGRTTYISYLTSNTDASKKYFETVKYNNILDVRSTNYNDVISNDVTTYNNWQPYYYDPSIVLLNEGLLQNNLLIKFFDDATVFKNYRYINYIENGKLYSNYVSENVINIDYVKYETEQNIKFDNVLYSSVFYFSKDDKFYWCYNRTDDNNDLQLYLPEENEQDFEDTIVKITDLDSERLGVFLKHGLYFVQATDSGYTYAKSNINVTCTQGLDILPYYTGQYLLFGCNKGLVSMSYQVNVASTEQILTEISTNIEQQFKSYCLNQPLKLTYYKNYLLCYGGTDDKKLYIFDFRNNSWWRFKFDGAISKIIESDTKLYLLINNKLYELYNEMSKSVDMMFDYDKPIDWYFKSQILHLGSVNNKKHISNMQFNAVTKEYDLLESSFKLQITNYRKRPFKSDTETVTYDVDVIGSKVKKFNYFNVNQFQYELSNNDKEAIKLPFFLNSIITKYKITSQMR